jgi:Ca2+-binding EF-hand superfamily protein
MNRFLSAAAVFGLVLALTAPAGAADEKKKKKKAQTRGADATALFTKLDTNSDGKLSKDEFNAFKGFGKKADAAKEPKGLSAARDTWFDKLDANKDGSLSKDEFAKLKDVVAANPAKKKKATK